MTHTTEHPRTAAHRRATGEGPWGTRTTTPAPTPHLDSVVEGTTAPDRRQH